MPATKTPSTHHPRRRNVTTSIIGLEKGHVGKNLTENGWELRRKRIVSFRDTAWKAEEEKHDQPQRYSWELRRRRMVNPRDVAGNAEEEEEW